MATGKSLVINKCINCYPQHKLWNWLKFLQAKLSKSIIQIYINHTKVIQVTVIKTFDLEWLWS